MEFMVVVFMFVFGIAGVAILTEHMQKMAKIKAEAQQKGGREVLEAIESLRREVAELRDTSTRYDLSFDTALQRLESRVAHLETSQRAVVQAAESARSTTLG